MTKIARANGWVVVDTDPPTTLTYAPRVDPSPLTVSVPGRDPTLGSLVVVITNGTPDDVQVSSVTFTIVVGKPGPEGTPLTPTTAGVKTLVSDTTTWSFTGPTSPVTSGTADYVLQPATGTTATLAAGASVYVEIYDFQTVQNPSTSTVAVEEVIGGGDPQFTSFDVSTFPDGFFFDGLLVNVQSGSALVPVAQVPVQTGVTLTWNSSLVDTASQTVFWSSATGGQQRATPTKLGEWSTPAGSPLTSDTVFVVVVTAKGSGGEPLSAALVTAVAVQNPALVASSLQTGSLTATGNATVGGTLTANGAVNATAGLTASSATVNGPLNAGGLLNANGGLTASSATVNGPLTANGATVNGQLRAIGAILASNQGVISSGPISAPSVAANGSLQVTGSTSLTYAFIQRLWANTNPGDGNAVYAANQSNQYPAGWFQNATPRTENWVTGLYAKVAQGSDWGLYTNGRSGSANLAVSHVETRNGHRVVTSPIVLAPEVHVSGRARLEGGRATVELDPEVADMLASDGEDPYRVLVTPTTRCNGLAVTSKEAASFAVEELLDGASEAEFDWLLIGRKRRELGAAEADELPESLPDVLEPPAPPRE